MSQTFLLTGTRAPATLDLARRLSREGVRVLGADSMRFPVGRFSKAFDSHHRVPSPRFRRREFIDAILRLVETEKVTLLWPTCEEIFHLAAHHDEISKTVRLLCDPLVSLEPLHHKLHFSQLAGKLAPESWAGKEAPEHEELIWKPVYSRFGARIRFEAPADRNGWMAQEYLRGEEFSSWSLCVDGSVRTLTFYDCPGRLAKGAGWLFDPMWDESAAAFITDFARSRGFTGSLSFDFVRDEYGKARVIECNPRLTSGIHVLDHSIRLSDLLTVSGPIPPPMRASQLLLPTLVGSPLLTASSPDIISVAGDRGPGVGQLAGLAEMTAIAIRRWRTLSGASTGDIEYNGD